MKTEKEILHKLRRVVQIMDGTVPIPDNALISDKDGVIEVEERGCPCGTYGKCCDNPKPFNDHDCDDGCEDYCEEIGMTACSNCGSECYCEV